MNNETLRKLLNSGNIEDAQIAFSFLGNKSLEEIREITGDTVPVYTNCVVASDAKFLHLDIIGEFYTLEGEDLEANIYSHGIIISKKPINP